MTKSQFMTTIKKTHSLQQSSRFRNTKTTIIRNMRWHEYVQSLHLHVLVYITIPGEVIHVICLLNNSHPVRRMNGIFKEDLYGIINIDFIIYNLQ